MKTKFRNFFFVSGLGVKTDLETFELVGNPSIVPMSGYLMEETLSKLSDTFSCDVSGYARYERLLR